MLARKTVGFVGADLCALTREAAVIAVNRIFALVYAKKNSSTDTLDPNNGRDQDEDGDVKMKQTYPLHTSEESANCLLNLHDPPNSNSTHMSNSSQSAPSHTLGLQPPAEGPAQNTPVNPNLTLAAQTPSTGALVEPEFKSALTARSNPYTKLSLLKER